jgi:hypothetical protein
MRYLKICNREDKEHVKILNNLQRWKERKNAQESEAEEWENTEKIR